MGSTDDRRQAVALFRYSLIRETADPALGARERGALVRSLAERDHLGPAGERPRVADRGAGRAGRGERPDAALLRTPWPAGRPIRRPSGQRVYSEDAVRLLRTIKAVQRLGFTLTEIEELLDLAEHRRGTGELHRRAQAKVAEIDAKIAQLQRVRQVLLAAVAAECDSLTDCSCGLGSPLPVLEITGPGGANGDQD